MLPDLRWLEDGGGAEASRHLEDGGGWLEDGGGWLEDGGGAGPTLWSPPPPPPRRADRPMDLQAPEGRGDEASAPRRSLQGIYAFRGAQLRQRLLRLSPPKARRPADDSKMLSIEDVMD